MATAGLARHGLTGPTTGLEGRRVPRGVLRPLPVAAALLGGGLGNPLSDEELAGKFHDNAVRSLPEERAVELAARTLALPDAQSVEDLTALQTSAGER